MEISAVSASDYGDIDDLGETKTTWTEKSHSTPFWEKLFFQKEEKAWSGRTVEVTKKMGKCPVEIKDAEITGRIFRDPDGKTHGGFEINIKLGPEDKNKSS